MTTAALGLGCRLLATVALAVGLAVAGHSAAHAQTGGLGFLPSGVFSAAQAVSANGSIVVGQSGAVGFDASRPTPLGGEAVFWNIPSAQTITPITPLSGGTFSIAYGVNGSGSVIVGESGAPNFENGKAFIWTASTGPVGLALGGGAFSVATGVNANSTSSLDAIVVGQSGSSNFPLGEAFIYRQGTISGLGALPGNNVSGALGVTPDGSVVVGSSGTSAGGGSGQPFRWTVATGMVGLGTLPTGAGRVTVGQAVNSDGTVIVGTSQTTTFPNGQAFRWTCSTPCSGGTMVALGALSGGTFSAANAVSADGSVIVGQSSSTSAPTGEAFIWTSSTGMQSLQALLSNAAFAGWRLTTALGISADGRRIVGFGVDPNGRKQAWVATTLGPQSASIVAAVAPTARTTTINSGVTAYATIINAGTATATSCSIALPSGVSANFLYQATNTSGNPIGSPNSPVSIAAGQAQGFYFLITPTAAMQSNINLVFDCTNTSPAPVFPGINQFRLIAASTQGADVLMASATAPDFGLMDMASPSGSGFFAVAAVNIGPTASITFTPTYTPIGQSTRTLPLTSAICHINPSNGQCISPPTPGPSVTLTVATNQVVNFGVFVSGQGTFIPLDLANNRVFVVAQQGATPLSQTSVAVRMLSGGGPATTAQDVPGR